MAMIDINLKFQCVCVCVSSVYLYLITVYVSICVYSSLISAAIELEWLCFCSHSCFCSDGCPEGYCFVSYIFLGGMIFKDTWMSFW